MTSIKRRYSLDVVLDEKYVSPKDKMFKTLDNSLLFTTFLNCKTEEAFLKDSSFLGCCKFYMFHLWKRLCSVLVP